MQCTIASSPAHDLALGVCKSSMHLLFEFTNELGVSKCLKDDVSKNLFESCSSNINFLPTTILNECKTTGWFASDFIRTMKMWLWMCRNIDAIIEKHFNVINDDDSKKCNSLMCSAYSLICNMEAPETREEKRK